MEIHRLVWYWDRCGPRDPGCPILGTKFAEGAPDLGSSSDGSSSERVRSYIHHIVTKTSIIVGGKHLSPNIVGIEIRSYFIL